MALTWSAEAEWCHSAEQICTGKCLQRKFTLRQLTSPQLRHRLSMTHTHTHTNPSSSTVAKPEHGEELPYGSGLADSPAGIPCRQSQHKLQIATVLRKVNHNTCNTSTNLVCPMHIIATDRVVPAALIRAPLKDLAMGNNRCTCQHAA